jgi:hypothetical protein
MRLNSALPNQDQISDATLLSFLNTFVTEDVPQEIQELSYKAQWQFTTEANIDQYNFPVNTYVGIHGEVFCNGSPLITSQSYTEFYRRWQENINPITTVSSGNGGPSYSWTGIGYPAIRGHTNVLGTLYPGVYINTTSVNGTFLTVTDDGNGNLIGDGTGTIDYLSGSVSVTFSQGTLNPIYQNNYTYSGGEPSACLFYDNILTFRDVPDKPYLIQVEAYVNPVAFASTNAPVILNFMAKFFIYGATRYLLLTYKDLAQLAVIDPLYREQEQMLLNRSQRQRNNVIIQTIYNVPASPPWMTNNPATGL